jgi:hypothetical protein
MQANTKQKQKGDPQKSHATGSDIFFPKTKNPMHRPKIFSNRSWWEWESAVTTDIMR